MSKKNVCTKQFCNGSIIDNEDIAQLQESLGNFEAAETIRFSAQLKAGTIGIEAARPVSMIPRRIA